MRCKIQCSSVSLWSDNGKCQNFQYMCLEMSPKVIRVWQEFKQTNIMKSNMLFVDTATSTKLCVCCITYIYRYTKSMKSFITAWKKLNFAGVELYCSTLNCDPLMERSGNSRLGRFTPRHKQIKHNKATAAKHMHTHQNYSSGIHPPGRRPLRGGKQIGTRVWE